MAETFHKTPADATTPGYRPLPGSGPTRGADLRTTVYAGLGIALGIFAGTFVADGTVQRMLAEPTHQVAQVRAQGAAVAPSPSVAAVSTPQAIAAATAPAAAAVPAAEPHEATRVGTVDSNTHSAPPVPPTKLPQVMRGVTEVASVQKAPVPAESKPAFSKKDEGFSTAAHRVSVVHRHRSGRRTTSRRVHLSRRRGRGGHRLHPLERTALPVRDREMVRATAAPAARLPAEEPSGFTVEGSLTVANFDPSRGVVQTYEGESFALGRAVSDPAVVSWLEYPADLHYLCDQSGNCTLVHGRVLVGSAKRTK
jgi:hypothetical protein